MILKDMVKPLYRLLKYVFLKIKYVFLCKNNCVDNFLKGKEDFSLFITHNLGGGTFHYEKNYVKENLEKKILILRIFSYGKDLCYRLENKERGEELYISPSYISKVFDNKFKEIIINSLIQIYDLFSFIDLLLKYKTKYPEILYTYHIHDFHCICPGISLVVNNWDCSLNCESHNCKFDKFNFGYNGDIAVWRNKWFSLLKLVNMIVCFSENSKKKLLSVYSGLDSTQIKIRPHSMEYCNFVPIKNIDILPFHIGFIGSVHYALKGRFVVQELLNKLPESVPITFVGSTKKQIGIKRNNTEYLGAYKQADLQKIIEENKISFVIFPSVCSETFSYLISELMKLNIPIICFDLGAQADKLRTYKKGFVCKDVSEIISFISKEFIK